MIRKTTTKKQEQILVEGKSEEQTKDGWIFDTPFPHYLGLGKEFSHFYDTDRELPTHYTTSRK